MAEVNLGTIPVNTLRTWVGFTPIVLKAKQFYNPVLRLTSASLERVYSRFKIRYKITVSGITYIVNPGIPRFSPDGLPQYFRVEVINLGQSDPSVTFEVIRLPYYSTVNLAADVTANLRLDDKL